MQIWLAFLYCSLLLCCPSIIIFCHRCFPWKPNCIIIYFNFVLHALELILHKSICDDYGFLRISFVLSERTNCCRTYSYQMHKGKIKRRRRCRWNKSSRERAYLKNFRYFVLFLSIYRETFSDVIASASLEFTGNRIDDHEFIGEKKNRTMMRCTLCMLYLCTFSSIFYVQNAAKSLLTRRRKNNVRKKMCYRMNARSVHLLHLAFASLFFSQISKQSFLNSQAPGNKRNGHKYSEQNDNKINKRKQ